MQEVHNFKLDYAGKPLKIQVGKLAHQAAGSCTIQYGETVVLATATVGAQPKEGIDYFPLMVDYEEKLYAAGKIKGSKWIKREGRATDEAVLTARVIDRSIRPLFKETERKDVQVMVTVLAVDGENDPDVPALLAASCALSISPIPWGGPVAAVRVGQINGEWVLNGSYTSREKSNFDLYLAGTENEVVMIETGARQVKEEILAEAIAFGQKHLKTAVKLLTEIKEKIGLTKTNEIETPEQLAEKEILKAKIEPIIAAKIEKLFAKSQEETGRNMAALTEEINVMLKADSEVTKDARAKGVAMVEEHIAAAARKLILEKNIRTDGRALDEIRELTAEVALLPRVHGSGLFQRGETQVLSVVTLGAPGDELYLESMEEEGKKRYMHHYNFPGFATGEVKPSRGPGRREIGHGALAEKALEPVIPDKEIFPYTIRVVSEVLGSNGSSSQASICGSTLSLMDAGVPILAPVAGIAIGLVTDPKDKKNYKILTDIQGIEDHAFDMDFKVAGTETGVTAIQMDIKLGGVSWEVCKDALTAAKVARMKVLGIMKEAIAAPRADLSPHAPRIITLHINPELIRTVIGPGGKMINKIIDECNVAIDIEQDGTVFITSVTQEGMEKAVNWVNDLTKEVEVGEIYEGTVTQIIKGQMNGDEIGAIVEILPGKDGMVHISNLDWKRVDKVTDILNIGDTVKVKVMEVDKERDRISLSRKELLPKPENYEERLPIREPRPGGFDRYNDRGPKPPRKPFFKR